jgi:hypothetical protein
MSADNDFLTPKLRFDKKTYPFPRAQDPVPTKIVEVLLLTRRFVPMELSWSLDLSGQLLGPLAGVVLDARAHPLARAKLPSRCRATNRYERWLNGALKLDQRWLRVRKGHPIWSAGATTLLCDDETGEPRWHRGHRWRPETAAPQCGGVLNAAGGKAIRILDARDDRKAFGAAHGRHQREQ